MTQILELTDKDTLCREVFLMIHEGKNKLEKVEQVEWMKIETSEDK